MKALSGIPCILSILAMIVFFDSNRSVDLQDLELAGECRQKLMPRI